LKLGEFEHYCECLIKLNKWEKALAFAPAVSYDYWQVVAKRYAEHLNSEDNEDTSGGLLISGQIEDAIKYNMNRADYEDAKLLSHLKLIGKFDHLMVEDRYTDNTKVSKTPVSDMREANDEVLREIIENLSETYLKNGQPLLAAASHLSITDSQSAAMKLYRSNELLYAYVISKLFNLSTITLVANLLSRRAERIGERPLGVKLLKAASNNKWDIGLYFGNTPGTKETLAEAYNANGLQSFEQYEAEAEKHLANRECAKAVYALVLARNSEKAATVAVYYAQETFANKQYENFAELMEALEILANTNITAISNAKVKYEALAFSIYFGMKKAMWKGYYPIVHMIYKSLKRLLKAKADLIKFPVSIPSIKLDFFRYTSILQPEDTFKKLSKLIKTLTNENDKNAANLIMKNMTTIVLKDSKLKRLEREFNRNREYITGSNLPTHVNSDNLLRSFITKVPIKAEGYVLDDNQSLVTLEEAVMWCQATRHSPTMSGSTMNPF
jgi:hypothetical protein